MSVPCDEFDARLNDWIDDSIHASPSKWNELSSDPHVRGCQRCQQTLQLWARIDPLVAYPVAKERSHRQTESRPGTGRRSRYRRHAWAVAASAAMVAWGYVGFSPQRSPDPNVASGILGESIDTVTLSSPLTVMTQSSSVASPQADNRVPSSIRVVTPAMALVASPVWMQHVSIAETWPNEDVWPVVGTWAGDWSTRTAPAMNQLAAGVEPLSETLLGIARSITGRDDSRGARQGMETPAAETPSHEGMSPDRLDGGVHEREVLSTGIHRAFWGLV